MCSPVLLLALQLAAAGPDPAAVQRQLDSVGMALAAVREELTRREGGRDTVTAGALGLAGAGHDRAARRAVLEPLANEWTRLFAGAAPAAVLEWTGPRWQLAGHVTAGWRAATAPRASALASLRGESPDVASRRALGQLLLARADTAISNWIAGFAVGLPAVDPDELAYQYATTRGPAAVRCRNGAVDRCADALGLGSPLAAKEFTGDLRASVLAYALSVGGEGAWTRLTADPAVPLGRRLALAAGLPSLDAVFLAWHRDVLAGPRRSGPADALRWIAAGLWLVAAMTVAVAGRRT